ncbi:MAG: DUF4124 domain-containing protein [Thiohalocapsa sp.]
MITTRLSQPSPSGLIALLFVMPLILVAGVAMSQQIYKSVDADGVVTYSASPPRDAPSRQIEHVRVDPAPPAAERAAAEKRLESMRRSADSDGSSKQSEDQDDAASNKAGSSSTAESRDEQLERARSSNRIARPAGGSGTAKAGRSAGQLPSGRTSR